MEKRIKELEEDKLILKKLPRFIPREAKYQAITTLKSRGIKRLCALFEVSESAYYAQCKAVKTPQKHTALSPEIKSLFVESRGSAGKRTLRDLLRQKGIFVGLYLIGKLMKQQGLFSKQPQKWQNRNKENGQILANHEP
ncbi:Tra5 protein [Aggregatibacter actinomycetemcomitans NUM4039]|nr:Tra5 protein [Aggregatibacter actinomycetemcomitans NUM4039]